MRLFVCADKRFNLAEAHNYAELCFPPSPFLNHPSPTLTLVFPLNVCI